MTMSQKTIIASRVLLGTAAAVVTSARAAGSRGCGNQRGGTAVQVQDNIDQRREASK